MAKFKDRSGQEWRIELDAILVQDARDTFSIDLVDLKADPLLRLRNDPMTLIDLTYLLCEDQVKEAGIDQRQFAKAMPHLDPILEAVKEAIIDFFPTGRASHVREVLTKYQEMAAKTDQLAVEKINEMIADPAVMERLRKKAGEDITVALDATFGKS